MNLFTILPVDSGSTIASPDPADVEYLTAYEPDAYAHWSFQGASDAVLTAQGTSGRELTLQGDAPAYGADYLGLNMLEGNALLPDLEETALATDTWVAVIRLSDPGLLVLGGTLETGPDGGSLFVGNAPRKLYSTNRGNSIAITESVANAGVIADDTWTFVAMARDFAGATKRVRQALGAEVVETIGLPGVVYLPNIGAKLALGHAYYDNGSPGGQDVTMDVAEFILYDRALSAEQLVALYNRRKAKLATLGIAVA